MLKARFAYKNENLEGIAKVPFMDLNIVFYRTEGCDETKEIEDARGNLITDEQLEDFGLTTADIFMSAVHNSISEKKEMRSLRDTITDIIGEASIDLEVPDSDAPNVMVLTTEGARFGAIKILGDDVKKFADKVDGNVVIIPSSIHEVLLMPEGAMPGGLEEINQMISEINTYEVADYDVLEDHAYIFDKERQEIVNPMVAEAVG